MKSFNGKMKAITFSYDDGVEQDLRLIELLDKYGLKCTFNLNSGKMLGCNTRIVREEVTVDHFKLPPEKIREVYQNHEVAGHSIDHPNLTKVLDDKEVIRQVEDDRLRLSELVGYNVQGFAYPCGPFNERVASIIRENTGIKFARTVNSTHSFDVQTELYTFHPTVHQHGEFDKMIELAKEFIDLKPDTPKLFYIWGHAYELDIRNEWGRLEEFFKLISGRDDIFYGTNSEVLL